MRYFFPDPPDISLEPSGTCNTCGYRRDDPNIRHRKVFMNWVCDLVLLDNGHWIHRNRVYEYELQGRKVVHKLLEDAV